MGAGRPSSYTAEIADELCERIAAGESVRGICADEWMPNDRTVRRWLSTNEDFARKCARAWELQADTLVDGMAALDADVLADVVSPDKARVVFSNRQWRAAKLAPKRYGDKLALGGANDLPPMQTITRLELVAGVNRADTATAETD